MPISESLQAARESAVSMGVPAPSQGIATAMRFLARLIDARAAVVIGAGTGTTGLALFEGMNANGVLTAIDAEAQRTDEAKRAFDRAGLARRRYRAIPGVPLDVLANLQSGAYDIVLVDGDKLEYVEYVAQGLRLLRHGGVIVLNDALWHNLVADTDNEDDETVIIREALQSVLDTEEFTPVLLPVGGGLLAAVKA